VGPDLVLTDDIYDLIGSSKPRIGDRYRRYQFAAQKLPNKPAANVADSYDPNVVRQLKSVSESSRQLPCRGGVPPEPRSRSTAAINDPTLIARAARRISLITEVLPGMDCHAAAWG